MSLQIKKRYIILFVKTLQWQNKYTDLLLFKRQTCIAALEQKPYWANQYEMTGSAGHYLKDNKIDGLIVLTAFGCGPDSLMIENIARKSKEFGKPLLSLTIDEHTGEAGFITRLEAFIDMLYRKKRSTIINKIEMRNYDYVPQTNICDYIKSAK